MLFLVSPAFPERGSLCLPWYSSLTAKCLRASCSHRPTLIISADQGFNSCNSFFISPLRFFPTPHHHQQCFSAIADHTNAAGKPDTDAGMKGAANGLPGRRAAFTQSTCTDTTQTTPSGKAHHPWSKLCTDLADAGPILLYTIQACPMAIAGIFRATWTL